MAYAYVLMPNGNVTGVNEGSILLKSRPIVSYGSPPVDPKPVSQKSTVTNNQTTQQSVNVQEVQRKAKNNIPLTNPTQASQKVYDDYIEQQAKEIERKAANNIPVTDNQNYNSWFNALQSSSSTGQAGSMGKVIMFGALLVLGLIAVRG